MMELKALSGTTPQKMEGLEDENSNIYFVDTEFDKVYLADRLTYWESVAESVNKNVVFTLQSRLESTLNVIRNGVTIEDLNRVLPFSGKVPLSNRRSLRYGTHGIHEYRGKFFPQLVKSLLNFSKADENSIILDPMCGSGTTLVEASLFGSRGYGIDQNPLSVFVSKVKCDLLNVDPENLWFSYIRLKQTILSLAKEAPINTTWLFSLSHHDQKYLREWFSNEVLEQLDLIMVSIIEENDSKVQDFFKVCLSNIIRSVSWQKDADLRVRKEVRDDVDIDVVDTFIIELNRSIKAVIALLIENKNNKVGNINIYEGDARSVDLVLNELIGKVDLCITSPPYATALPYLDTDRLSLYYLGFMSRSSHREKDYKMIGNREITKGLKKSYWDVYLASKASLSANIVSVIDKIHELNENSDAGFRRKNLSSLLAKYFLDMRDVFESHKKLLKHDALSVFIVGNNHTIANGERVEIRTDELLAELGAHVGLELLHIIPMELLHSRDIFKNNAGNTEKIIIFRNS